MRANLKLQNIPFSVKCIIGIAVIFFIYSFITKKINSVTPDICIINTDATHRIGVKYYPAFIDNSEHQQVYTSTDQGDWTFSQGWSLRIYKVYDVLHPTDLSAKDPRICEQLIKIQGP